MFPRNNTTPQSRSDTFLPVNLILSPALDWKVNTILDKLEEVFRANRDCTSRIILVDKNNEYEAKSS